MPNTKTDHATEQDVEAIRKDAQRQGVIVPDPHLANIYMEFLILVFEAGWQAGYTARMEGK